MQLDIVNRYMFDNINRLIEKGLLAEKKIILFGLNTSSYAAKNYLEDRGFSIYAYIDNDMRKRNEVNDAIEEILPHQIGLRHYRELQSDFIYAYKPEELLCEFDNDVVILIASKYYDQMCEQLEKMGYQEETHIFKTVDFYGMEEIFKNLQTEDCGREMTSREIRDCQMDILRYVRNICQSNGLRYYLCGGTLLGAVRHKGYIPWDDDIDVIMPYSDYKKMIEIVVKEDGQYKIWSPYNYGEKYFCFFSRLIDSRTVMKAWEYPFLMHSGVNIDIFPLSGLPEKEEDILYFYNKVRRLHTRFISTFIENHKETEELLEERKKLHDMLIQLLEKYDFDESEKAFTITKYKEREILPTSIYDKGINMEFENDVFIGPEGYDSYLKSLYGDYMQLPPENQQHTVHNYKAFWRKQD